MTQPDYETYRKMMEAQQAEAEEALAAEALAADASAADAEEEYFTAEEIAAYLQVPVDDFHTQAAHGDLRPVQIEEVYVYAKKDVKRFLINLGILEGESQW